MKITFPNKTAKQIVKACDNKLGNGKLLWSPEGWYEKEEFYTKEKCRGGTFEIDDEISHYNKSWDECSKMQTTDRGMMNFSEYIWFIKTYYENNGKYPEENEVKYSWTSSRSSDGYLVRVGYCGSDGVGVYSFSPGYSRSRLGVRFSRSVEIPGAKPEQGEADYRSLELRVAELERKMKDIYIDFN